MNDFGTTLEAGCRDFFSHLTVEKLLRKALRGDIPLPIVRIEASQKAHRGMHFADLADYIDKRPFTAWRRGKVLSTVGAKLPSNKDPPADTAVAPSRSS